MDHLYSKPQEAREIEARARARQLRVRVAVVAEAQSYVSSSQSQRGVTYAIQRTPVGWACSCAGYRHTGACKHLGQVERRSEREGWEFGAVAPLHRVARYLPLELPARSARGRTPVAIPTAAVVAFPPAGPSLLHPARGRQRGDDRSAA